MNNKLTRPDNLRLPDRLRAAKSPAIHAGYNGAFQSERHPHYQGAIMGVKRIGILTGGGDVPGLNSVIKSVVYRGSETSVRRFGNW